MPAQKLTGMAIDYQSQGGPAIAPRPDPAEIRRPAFVRCSGHGWHRFDAWPHADRTLANLPALDLEDSLNRVFVEAQKPGHGAIAE